MEHSINDLSKLLVELGKKRHGLDCAYPFAMGTIVGLVDSYIKYRPWDLQEAINLRYTEIEKELEKEIEKGLARA